MAHKIVMPQFGVTTTKGTIVKWCKKIGDSIKIGEIIFEVETDKITTEVESTVEGILLKTLYKEGDEIQVTSTVAIVGEPGEDISALETEGSNIYIAGVKEQGVEIQKPSNIDKNGKTDKNISSIKISPVAKKLAQKNGITNDELVSIVGTGYGGILSKKDIIDFIENKKNLKEPKAASSQLALLSEMRKAIANNMLNSWQNIPQFNLRMDINASSMIKKRNAINEELKSNSSLFFISYNDFFVKAAAMAIVDFPSINSIFSINGITKKENINIGLAVALDNGLIVPNIKDADKKSLLEIAESRIRIIDNAKRGNLSSSDITNGTLTISNLGFFDVDSFTAIINPPETIILAVGKIREKLVFSDNKIENQPYFSFVATIDHRIVDGAQGAQFLQKFKEYIEDAENIV